MSGSRRRRLVGDRGRSRRASTRTAPPLVAGRHADRLRPSRPRTTHEGRSVDACRRARRRAVASSARGPTRSTTWPGRPTARGWRSRRGSADEERYGKEKEKDQPPRRITRLFSRLDSVGWTVDRPTHLFVVAADGSSARRGASPHGPVRGRRPGLVARRHAARVRRRPPRRPGTSTAAVDLYVVDVDGGEPRRLTETGRASRAVVVARTARRIAVHVSDDGDRAPRHSQVGVLDRPTAATQRVLTERARPQLRAVPAPARAGVGRRRPLVRRRGHRQHPSVSGAGRRPGKPSWSSAATACVTGFDVAGGDAGVHGDHADGLAELFVRVDGDERGSRSSVRRSPSGRASSTPERFTATSADGTEVEAWIMRPAGAQPGKRYPTLLNIHGGPFTQYGNRSSTSSRCRPAPATPSSTQPAWLVGLQRGVGTGHPAARRRRRPGHGLGRRRLRGPDGGRRRGARRFDFVDADRLGVLGGSYGGYRVTSSPAGVVRCVRRLGAHSTGTGGRTRLVPPGRVSRKDCPRDRSRPRRRPRPRRSPGRRLVPPHLDLC